MYTSHDEMFLACADNVHVVTIAVISYEQMPDYVQKTRFSCDHLQLQSLAISIF